MEKKIMAAQSTEGIEELFREEGEGITKEETAELYEYAKARQEGRMLSLDKLEEVAGGCDGIKDGCAATVKPGFDCWGTDAGCTLVHVSYSNAPSSSDRCPTCGGYVANMGQYAITDPNRRTAWRSNGVCLVNRFTCRKCGEYQPAGFRATSHNRNCGALRSIFRHPSSKKF